MQISKPYSKFAEIYDRIMGHIDYKKWASFILKSGFPNSIPNSALDLGCGTGALLNYFPAVTRKVGIDISPEMIREAKINYPDMDFQIGDIREIKVDSTFELITCNHDTINYLQSENDLKKHFATIRNILKDEGLYFFDVSTERNLTQNFHDKIFRETIGNTFFIWENSYDQKNKEIISNLYFGINDQNGFQEFKETHKQRYYSLEEIKEALEKTGLELLRTGSDYKKWSYDKNASLMNFKVKKK